ncbi:uncharacterized protein YbaR (Trm112 family) [Lewinella marina]|uniref:Trm112 family protein n=1 Tax=Neolewinella marina TaxID=438751 RepID=A0A2G0CKG9_9BACT|nr:Trm112 family protein [Neolewinella marina]NJB84333.1 uncharacterized protein YbaR (Trm112 family) [Neolewinella marina]PHL00467.1 hypothetical protein CGL56_05395 [Neolewinella marina]
MQKNLLDKLCCPFDKGDLNAHIFRENDNGDILEGLLTCPACRRYYPIIYSIPIMSPDEYRERQLELPILERWGLKVDTHSPSFVLEAGSAQKLLG